MIIHLVTIEPKETKFVCEVRYKDSLFWAAEKTREKVVKQSQEYIRIINMSRNRDK